MQKRLVNFNPAANTFFTTLSNELIGVKYNELLKTRRIFAAQSNKELQMYVPSV